MKHFAVLSGIALVASLLAGCAGTSSAQYTDENGDPTTTEAVNTDPRKGWVEIQEYQRRGSEAPEQGIWKKCDGSTLMYVNKSYGPSTGISTIPDSEECVG